MAQWAEKAIDQIQYLHFRWVYDIKKGASIHLTKHLPFRHYHDKI